jgi:TPR repeat protein
MAGLGQLYTDGTGTSRDLVKAAAWLHAAAAAGNSDAMFAYGNMALKGEGMAPRPVEAYRWLALAAVRAPEGPERTAAQEALAQPSLKKLAPETRQIMDMTAELWQPAAPIPPAIDAR